MMLLELARIVVCVVVMLTLSGTGLTLLLVRAGSGRWALLVAPFVGLAVTSSIAHLTSSLGLPAVQSIWILVASSLILVVLGVRIRRAALRGPRAGEWVIAMAALPAVLLSVWPMVAIDRLLPIGDTNCDPISYSAVADFLARGSLREPPEIKLEYPTRVPVEEFIQIQERMGFVLIAAYSNVLAGAAAHQSFSALAGVGFALGAVGTGALAAAGFAGGAAAGFAAAILYAISAFPLWVVYGGYASQALGSGLIPMVLWLGGRALRRNAWRDRALAGILVSAVAGIYSESLPYVGASLALLVLIEVAQTPSDLPAPRSRWRPVFGLLVIAAVAFAFDPIAATRAIGRLRSIITAPSQGNVHWYTDPRQVLGLLPFVPPEMIARGRSTELLWAPFFVLLGLVAAGFTRLKPDGRQLALAFAVPALISVEWLVWRGFPYGEFKAWSIGAFLPFALLGVGLAAVWEESRGRRASRLGVLIAALVGIVPVGVRSVEVARAMETRFAFSPALEEVSGWLSQIGREEGIFVSPGKLSPVSVFWIAYVLRNRRMHADTGICYTPFGNELYAGQPWVLRHRSSELVLDPAVPSRVVAANKEYELLTTRPESR